MSFPTASVEIAWTRKVMFALELIDPVSFELVSDGVAVTATGLARQPIVNHGGQFVWLAEAATPLRVQVDPGALRYEAEDLPAPLPPARLLRVVLRPRPGYVVPGGVTAVASSLYQHLPSDPVPAADADAWLQWKDASGGAGGAWIDAAPRSHTAASGDFLALLRLDASRVPELDATGQLRLRLAFERAGVVRTSADLFLPQGRTADLAPFAWDLL
jgi:hypothetical protein